KSSDLRVFLLSFSEVVSEPAAVVNDAPGGFGAIEGAGHLKRERTGRREVPKGRGRFCFSPTKSSDLRVFLLSFSEVVSEPAAVVNDASGGFGAIEGAGHPKRERTGRREAAKGRGRFC